MCFLHFASCVDSASKTGSNQHAKKRRYLRLPSTLQKRFRFPMFLLWLNSLTATLNLIGLHKCSCDFHAFLEPQTSLCCFCNGETLWNPMIHRFQVPLPSCTPHTNLRSSAEPVRPQKNTPNHTAVLKAYATQRACAPQTVIMTQHDNTRRNTLANWRRRTHIKITLTENDCMTTLNQHN